MFSTRTDGGYNKHDNGMEVLSGEQCCEELDVTWCCIGVQVKKSVENLKCLTKYFWVV